MTKGTLVELSGRASVRSWLGSYGQAHAGLNFHTSEITVYGGGTKTQRAKATAPKQGKDSKTANGGEDDDLPF